MKTVAVVDDEWPIRAVLQGVLEDEGYRVVAAADGEAALRLIREERPDLVLSDVMLPALNGVELARRVRDDPSLGDIPVVLMSAGRVVGPELQTLCRAFIPKPFSIDTVVEVVEEQLAS